MADTPAGTLPAPREALQFTGTGAEYFRIWIVNLLLSIVTLGIYSAWAKVRRLRYFYRNTRLAGAGFDYHGDPLVILKGRLIAFGLFLVYTLATQFSDRITALVLLLMLVVMPWLLHNSLRFRLHNSSYRGLRFAFRGRLGQSYITFGVLGTAALVTGFLWPLFHSHLKRYQHENTWYGGAQGSFHARDGQFYAVYMKASLLWLGFFVLVLIAAFGPLAEVIRRFEPEDPDQLGQTIAVVVLAAVALMTVLGMFLLGPYLAARLQNLVWNNTRLAEHRFESNVSARQLFWIQLTNLLGILLTLGLFMPWAKVRLARYRLESIALLPGGSLDDFVAEQSQSIQATGDEAAEFFDIDIGL